jgi:3-phosphoshikimate 1-carboxyvinyltransferase
MHERPQAALFAALRELGYRVEAEQGKDKLPARIFGGSSRGNEAPSPSEKDQSLLTSAATKRKCVVSIEESSQFASALLLCAKVGGWNVEVVGENAEESPYVAMTVKLIETFPHRGGKFQIEPDASSGSYFWAATGFDVEQNEVRSGNHVTKSLNFVPTVRVKSWPTSTAQVDSKFLAKLMEIGFQARRNETPFLSRRTDLGDSIMTVISLAPTFKGVTCFMDLGRLRLQECERVVALRTELTKCGAKVVEEGDTLTVYPSKLHGAEIETYNDHRMAMCFAILGLKVPGIKIKNPACVKKTFPNFFQKLAAPPPRGLGATIRDVKTGHAIAHEDLFAD